MTQGKHMAASTPAHTRKRIIAVLLVALIVCVLAVGSTFAYLTARTNEKVNTTNAGTVSVELLENGTAVSGSNSVTFGGTAKRVAVKNDGTAPVYVRVQIGTPMVVSSTSGGSTLYQSTSASGVDGYGFAAPTSNQVTIGGYTYHFASDWSDNWFYYQGFFYLKNPLTSSATSATLLEGITADDGDTATQVEVSVAVDGIQSDPTSFVTDAWGVTVNGSDGTISAGN